MTTKRPVNLSAYSKEKLREFFDQFDVIFCDCDGVLYINGTVIENSNKTINKLIKNGKQVFLITNNNQGLRQEILDKCQKLGFEIGIKNILTSPYLTAKYLNSIQFNKKVFVIGNEKIGIELDSFGIQHLGIGEDPMKVNFHEYVTQHYRLDPDVGAVVVSLDSHFSIPKLLKAMNYLLKPEVLFLATNADIRSEFPGFVFPDTGTILASIEKGSNRKATFIGKPSTVVCDLLELPEKRGKVLMIGDRLNIDMAFGNNAGFKTLLVETGDHNEDNVKELMRNFENGSGNEDENETFIPDFIISSLGNFANI